MGIHRVPELFPPVAYSRLPTMSFTQGTDTGLVFQVRRRGGEEGGGERGEGSAKLKASIKLTNNSIMFLLFTISIKARVTVYFGYC